jgi:hypothetical protein
MLVIWVRRALIDKARRDFSAVARLTTEHRVIQGAMNWLRVIAALLILWTLGDCAAIGTGSAPSPPPSQDDRGGMH